MVHVSIHWKDRGFNDLSLWSFSVGRTVWFHNRGPDRQSGLTPI